MGYSINSMTSLSLPMVYSTPSFPDVTGGQALFDEFEAYPFSDDPDFRAGLPTVMKAIRKKQRTPTEIDEMFSRAQWFYFTRIRRVSIPWENYVLYSHSQIHPLACPSRRRSSSPNSEIPFEPETPLSALCSMSSASSRSSRNQFTELNTFAETRRMMLDANGGDDHLPGDGMRRNSDGDEGMSFSLLCQLISEGRAGEVEGVQQIPDELNPQPASQSARPPRSKPWETPLSQPILPRTQSYNEVYNQPSQSLTLSQAQAQQQQHNTPFINPFQSMNQSSFPSGGEYLENQQLPSSYHQEPPNLQHRSSSTYSLERPNSRGQLQQTLVPALPAGYSGDYENPYTNS